MTIANKHHPYSGVTDIWINIILQGNNLTTRHTWVTQAPRGPPFAMTIKELDRILPRPSDISHMKTSMGSPWVTRTLSYYTSMKWGKVSSNSATIKVTKFVGPHKSCMWQYIINLIHQSQTTGPQLTQAGATTLELWIWHLTTLNLPI
jgi:hypothetical protein